MDFVPLHPVVVHLPLALSVVLPLFVLVAGALAWHRHPPARPWLMVPALALLIFGSALVAMNSGEADEEKVERVVPAAALEEHEETAEAFVWTAGGMLLLALLGLAPAPAVRRGAIVATAAASVALGGLALQTGKLGGELVYRHGAADAHRDVTVPTEAAPQHPLRAEAQEPEADEHAEADEEPPRPTPSTAAP
ncbi:MAG: DUF2231 domain-containing protein [Myxococcota bacterium]